MTDPSRRALCGVDPTAPNPARMHDYFLGGKDNFAADREAAEALLAIAPEIRTMARENRAFANRVVTFLTESGVRQFVDLGAGLPTRRNTHEIVRSIASDARVVYVDEDPVVLSHARALLAGDSLTGVAEGHILRPEAVLANDDVLRLIDFSLPVAVLVFRALHFIPHSDDPFKAVGRLRDALVGGSYLALSHVVFDDHQDVIEPLEEIYRAVVNRPGERAARNRDEVLAFFEGFELIAPGLVYVREWRPDNPLSAQAAGKVWMVGGVGRKPG